MKVEKLMFSSVQTGVIRPLDAIVPLWRAVSLDILQRHNTSWSPLDGMRMGTPRTFALPDIVLAPGLPMLAHGDVSTDDMLRLSDALQAEIDGRSRHDTHLRETLRAGAQLAAARHLTEGPDGIPVIERLRGLHTNFWWDIEHHVMLSFDADFMARLPEILGASWS